MNLGCESAGYRDPFSPAMHYVTLQLLKTFSTTSLHNILVTFRHSTKLHLSCTFPFGPETSLGNTQKTGCPCPKTRCKFLHPPPCGAPLASPFSYWRISINVCPSYSWRTCWWSSSPTPIATARLTATRYNNPIVLTEEEMELPSIACKYVAKRTTTWLLEATPNTSGKSTRFFQILTIAATDMPNTYKVLSTANNRKRMKCLWFAAPTQLPIWYCRTQVKSQYENMAKTLDWTSPKWQMMEDSRNMNDLQRGNGGPSQAHRHCKLGNGVPSVVLVCGKQDKNYVLLSHLYLHNQNSPKQCVVGVQLAQKLQHNSWTMCWKKECL